MSDALLVLDIGKTNAKLTLVDADGRVLAERRRPNAVLAGPPYPHHDTEGIWNWLLDTSRALAQLARVTAIVPVTHGATAALVDAAGLVLPVLDYEAALPGVDYDAHRPAYAHTYSPALPAGLNLGRQLAWLAQRFPQEFGRARHLLLYPQYWAWRLSGVAAAEATSLGCHTDLWEPFGQRYSSLVARMGWARLLPPMRPASATLGVLLPAVAAASGLPPSCQVLCGIHDSNASLVRYLDASTRPGETSGHAAPRTVLSTGTWVIAAAFGAAVDGLREDADMLVNTDALGRPVPCMRFMGGREFGELAGPGRDAQACTLADLERVIRLGTLALPCFAAGGAGRIDGPAPSDAGGRYALATLYVALMTDYCLDALGAAGPLAVEGSFTANPWFGGLLARLRPQQAVTYSDDASGTTHGAWLLRYPDRAAAAAQAAQAPRSVAPSVAPAGLDAYRAAWRAAVARI